MKLLIIGDCADRDYTNLQQIMIDLSMPVTEVVVNSFVGTSQLAMTWANHHNVPYRVEPTPDLSTINACLVVSTSKRVNWQLKHCEALGVPIIKP